MISTMVTPGGGNHSVPPAGGVGEGLFPQLSNNVILAGRPLIYQLALATSGRQEVCLHRIQVFPLLNLQLYDRHSLIVLLSLPKTLLLCLSVHLPFLHFGFPEFSSLFLLLFLLNQSEDVYLKASYTSHFKHFPQSASYE